MTGIPAENVAGHKRLTLALFALGLVTAAVACLVAARPAKATAAERTPALATRAAVAFDTSPPLDSMEQFIPDKLVVIHRAVESQPERQGATKGPGQGLGTTPPTRGSRAGRRGPGGRTCGTGGWTSADSASATRARDQRRWRRRRADDAGQACRD